MRIINVVVVLFWVGYSFHAQIDGINRISMDTSDYVSGFEPLDSLLEGKRIVFTGENHQFNVSNNIIKFKLIRHLYDKGYRYFTIEFGHGIGFLANEFVTKGDEVAWEILDSGKPEYEDNYLSDLLLPLREFNKDKSENDQVKIIGADFTRYPIFSLRAMSNLIFNSNCKKELSNYFEDINTIASAHPNSDELGFMGNLEDLEDFDIKTEFKSYQNKLFVLSVSNLIKDFYKDSILFKNCLVDEYDSFYELIQELESTIDWYDTEQVIIQSHTGRERHLTERILKILEKDSLAKIGGQFGRCHIRLNDFDQDCYAFDMNSVTQRLSENDLLIDQIAILPIYYEYNLDEIVFNKKSTTYNKNELIFDNAMFLYQTNKEWFEFNEGNELPPYVLINTFSPFIGTADAVSVSEMDWRYRAMVEEIHTDLGIQLRDFSVNNNLTNDFGINPIADNQLFCDYYFTSALTDGGNFTMGTSFVIPKNYYSDSVNYRYSNWKIASGSGYNLIYNKWMSLYSNVMVEYGLAKIREDRGISGSGFTYNFEKQRAKYYNPYLNFSLTTGLRIKFKTVSLFGECGYGYDVTNPKWRNKGILPHSAGQKFDAFVLRFGLSFYYKNRLGESFFN